ncbi:hypothetical protein QQ045_029283 [Rhodiola kirilowii]
MGGVVVALSFGNFERWLGKITGGVNMAGRRRVRAELGGALVDHEAGPFGPEALSRYSEYKHAREEDLQLKSNNKKVNKGYVAKTFCDKTRRSVQDSERYKRVGKDEFLRVLF